MPLLLFLELLVRLFVRFWALLAVFGEFMLLVREPRWEALIRAAVEDKSDSLSGR